MRVLIIEDDDRIALPLVKGLTREGFDTDWVAMGGEGLARLAGAAEACPDVVLLDLRLPDMDGFDLCRMLRSESQIPIIVVTSRGEETDRVLGLELGADDYVVKPFGFRELLARIRAVTRRAQPTGPDLPPLRVGALAINRRTRRVTLRDRELGLTPKEFDLLVLLAESPDTVWSRRRIIEEVWDTHWCGPTKTLDFHIAALRKKLCDPTWIETVRGVGFRFLPPPREAVAAPSE